MRLSKTEKQILEELEKHKSVAVSVHRISLRKNGGTSGTRKLVAARKLEKAGLIKEVRHHSGRMPANNDNTATLYYDEYVFVKSEQIKGLENG